MKPPVDASDEFMGQLLVAELMVASVTKSHLQG